MRALERSQVVNAQQATAIPYRQRGDKIEFCLVTSTAGRWIFPKGIIGQRESYVNTASNEALVEAGLHGDIAPKPLGFYEIQKDGQRLTVIALLMKVSQADKDWKESHWRKRRWVSAAKAEKLLAEDDLRDLLKAALGIVSSGHQ